MFVDRMNYDLIFHLCCFINLVSELDEDYDLLLVIERDASPNACEEGKQTTVSSDFSTVYDRTISREEYKDEELSIRRGET